MIARYGTLKLLSIFLRYLRHTPLLGVTILVSMSVLRFMGSGPLWPITIEYIGGNCKQYWWSTLIYIQNYVNPDEIVSVYKKKDFFNS